MTHCEKCIRYEMCKAEMDLAPDDTFTFFPYNEDCPHFKNKADFVEVKHGEWKDVYKGKYHNKQFVCSICGGKALYKFVTNELGNKRAIQDLTLGCPHCLARMEGD